MTPASVEREFRSKKLVNSSFGPGSMGVLGGAALATAQSPWFQGGIRSTSMPARKNTDVRTVSHVPKHDR